MSATNGCRRPAHATVFHPMCGTRTVSGSLRTTPGRTPRPGSASSSLASKRTCMPTHTPITGRPSATAPRIDADGSERRRLLRQPPDVLITTPESLYLLLTSSARETLRGVETVILDE